MGVNGPIEAADLESKSGPESLPATFVSVSCHTLFGAHSGFRNHVCIVGLALPTLHRLLLLTLFPQFGSCNCVAYYWLVGYAVLHVLRRLVPDHTGFYPLIHSQVSTVCRCLLLSQYMCVYGEIPS